MEAVKVILQKGLVRRNSRDESACETANSSLVTAYSRPPVGNRSAKEAVTVRALKLLFGQKPQIAAEVPERIDAVCTVRQFEAGLHVGILVIGVFAVVERIVENIDIDIIGASVDDPHGSIR